MIKIDQKNIRIFHILDNDENELKKFIIKNLPILEGYLLVFDNLSDDLKQYLDSNNIDYIKNNKLKLNQITPLNTQNTDSKASIKNDKHLNVESNSQTQYCKELYKTKFMKKVVRSGENIYNKGDLVILNRVNSASKIVSDNNISIFGDCDGDLECNGEYLILSRINKGKIVFNGEIITPNILKYKLNIIFKEDGKLNIKDILSL